MEIKNIRSTFGYTAQDQLHPYEKKACIPNENDNPFYRQLTTGNILCEQIMKLISIRLKPSNHLPF